MPKFTNVDTAPFYDNTANLEWVEQELATVMYIAGLDPEQTLNTVTIDEIIDAIESTFVIGDLQIAEQICGKDRQTNGAQAYIRKCNNKLANVARRHWRERHVAKWLSENEY